MKPPIEGFKFGEIQVGGVRYTHDILIRLDGTVEKRKKTLSKKVYGTSHTISLAEAEQIYEENATQLIIGGGKLGRVRLSDEATTFFEAHGVHVTCKPTGKAIRRWNKAEGRVIGLFHITC